jgi:hypothetical protein
MPGSKRSSLKAIARKRMAMDLEQQLCEEAQLIPLHTLGSKLEWHMPREGDGAVACGEEQPFDVELNRVSASSPRVTRKKLCYVCIQYWRKHSPEEVTEEKLEESISKANELLAQAGARNSRRRMSAMTH